MKDWKRLLPPIIILLIIAILGFGFDSFFRTLVIEPIALMFWALWRLAASIDQEVIWTILILVCAVSVVYLVTAGERRSPQSAYRLPIVSLNRLEHWQKLIESAASDPKEMDDLRGSLLDLLIHAGAAPGQSEKSSNPSDALDLKDALSDEAYWFLYPNDQNAPGSRFVKLNWEPKGLRKLLGKNKFNLERIVSEILQLLENELEITNGRQQ